MSQPQSAIVPDHCKVGIFIQANIATSDRTAIANACRQSLQAQYPEATLGLTIAFGSDYWATRQKAVKSSPLPQ